MALTPEMVATMRQDVGSCEYASASEVMREALRNCKRRRAMREQAMKELGRLWDEEGLASGASSDGEEAFVRIRQALDKAIATGRML
mgnify:CR=1 FL=1